MSQESMGQDFMSQEHSPARPLLRFSPIRLGEIPALFSEGPEPESRRPAHAPWPTATALKRLLAVLRGVARR
jgi:hypothetical protein